MVRETNGGAGGSHWLTNPQMVVALSALLLSVCGLFIAIYEASLIRRAQRASVWPSVQIGGTINDERVRLWVENNGVGPARVRSTALSRGGEVLESWEELLREVGADPDRVDRYQSLAGGRVLPAGMERDPIFEIASESGPQAAAAVVAVGREVFLGEIDVTVCYCSVYDECWVSSLQDLVAWNRGEGERAGSRKVESCDGAPRSGI
jgi:hypothetical protein